MVTISCVYITDLPYLESNLGADIDFDAQFLFATQAVLGHLFKKVSSMAAPPEQSASEDLLDVVAQLEALLLTTAAAGGSAAATAAASTGVAGSSATAQEPLRLLRAHAERLHRQLQGVKRLEKRTEAASTVPVQRVKLNIGGTEVLREGNKRFWAPNLQCVV